MANAVSLPPSVSLPDELAAALAAGSPLDMHSRRSVKNFNGSPTTHQALIAAWRIEIAPTVLFLGRQGVEVAQRLVGGYIPDFYGAYLEQRLETARAAVLKAV